MRRARTVAVVAAGLIIAITAGCTPVKAEPSSSPISETFESRASSRSLWDAYLVVYNKALNDPSGGVRDLEPYVTKRQLETAEQNVAGLNKNGLHLQGALRTRSFELQVPGSSRTPNAALVCIDNGGTRVIDAEGRDVTPSTRDRFYTVRVEMLRSAGILLIDKDAMWTDSSAC